MPLNRESHKHRPRRCCFSRLVVPLLALFLAAGLQAGARPDRVVVGYYPSWVRSTFDHLKIDYDALTHIAHAFAYPDEEGNLIIPDDYFYPALVQAAHSHQVKMLMSLGGGSDSGGFPDMAAEPSRRARFIGQVVEFCRANDYDGVDIDWEAPWGTEDEAHFTSLAVELSAALKAMDPPRLLTMAAPSGPYYGQWIDFEELVPYFDFFGFMTYDYHGPWTDHSGHNSPLYSCNNDQDGSVDETFQYARSRGVPLDKLLLGVPFYGRSFDCGGLGRSFQASEYHSFSEAVDYWYDGWVYHWDDCAKVPYLVNPQGTEILCFDDMYSVAYKCAYIVDHQAAGMIIWELSQDGFKGLTVLIRVIGTLFRGAL